MHTPATAPFVSFLSEPWWAGVQGLLAIVALVAVIVAVIDFLIRLSDTGTDGMHFSTMVFPADKNGLVKVIITARTMGPYTLYESKWRAWNFDFVPPAELPPVITARDAPQTITVYVPQDKVNDARVGIEWLVPRRWGTRAAATRIPLTRDPAWERWITYRWYGWPRRAAGRWVRARVATRGLLFIE